MSKEFFQADVVQRTWNRKLKPDFGYWVAQLFECISFTDKSYLQFGYAFQWRIRNQIQTERKYFLIARDFFKLMFIMFYLLLKSFGNLLFAGKWTTRIAVWFYEFIYKLLSFTRLQK